MIKQSSKKFLKRNILLQQNLENFLQSEKETKNFVSNSSISPKITKYRLTKKNLKLKSSKIIKRHLKSNNLKI